LLRIADDTLIGISLVFSARNTAGISDFNFFARSFNFIIYNQLEMKISSPIKIRIKWTLENGHFIL